MSDIEVQCAWDETRALVAPLPNIEEDRCNVGVPTNMLRPVAEP